MKFYEVKCFEPSYTLKKTKSQKKLARVYAYTHAYTQIREGGGKFAPPPSRIGLTYVVIVVKCWKHLPQVNISNMPIYRDTLLN